MSDSFAFRHRYAGGLPLMAAALSLSACVSNRYMGIPLTAGAAPSELMQLANRARMGNKQAQLKLGIAFEEGLGVPQNLTKARKLYRLAAADDSVVSWVYVPPSSAGQQGRVIAARQGAGQRGLISAKERLKKIGE